MIRIWLEENAYKSGDRKGLRQSHGWNNRKKWTSWLFRSPSKKVHIDLLQSL